MIVGLDLIQPHAPLTVTADASSGCDPSPARPVRRGGLFVAFLRASEGVSIRRFTTHIKLRNSSASGKLMHVQAVLAVAVLAGFVEFACLCHEAPEAHED